MEDLRSKVGPIRSLAAKLIEEFGADFFSITDYWDADLCAIGLRHEKTVVYLCCWENGGFSETNPRYYLEIEEDTNEDKSLTLLVVEHTTSENVLGAMRDFFGVGKS
jgi:hypothetical protein